MDVVETEVEVENTFINKLLGEMKHKFNKTDKIALSDDESLSSREYSSNSSNDIQDEDMNKISSVDVQDSPVIKVLIDTESNNHAVEVKTDKEFEIKEINTNEKDNLFTTFRKPSNSIKSKLKNIESNGETVKKTLRAKVHILDENIVLKRSPRRRSRDYSESILQSAIARKEKSYNESSRPQRLTRLLKPTPKILENLANAAALKLERNRKDKFKGTDEFIDYGSDSESESESDDQKSKRPKYQHGRNLKQGKRNNFKGLDCDQFGNLQETDEYDKCNKNIKREDRLQRRSNRLSSRSKDECLNLDDSRELPEASIPEDDCNPADPECSSLEAQLIASQLCLCTHKTRLYASTTGEDTVFCTALDGVGDRIVGCSSVVNVHEVPLLRPSTRVPFIILCEVHLNRMLRHNCCPQCGLFCTEGDFVQCDAKHQYHRECQLSIGQSEYCPHCGLPSPSFNVLINMHSYRKPVFLPLQRAHYPPAKMSFLNVKSKNENGLNLAIIPPGNLKTTKSTICLKYSLKQLYETMKEDTEDKVLDMLGFLDGSINSQLDSLENGTLLHYAAQNGKLSIVHQLVVAGADLNVMDKDQNTALVTAILGLENSVVSYLIKAGCSISLKGSDGMTPLHIAAKLGNVTACELLLDSAKDVKDYINGVDDGGWTPLVWACEHGHFEVARFLINRGADIFLRDVEHNTALHWAAFSGSEEIAEMLLNNESDVNAVNVHGDSPLHIGSRQDMYNFILILLTRGAHIDVTNKAGETPLDCCQPLSDCYTAVSLNLNLHTTMSSSNRNYAKTIILDDISRGREINPIQCSNILDDEQLPNDFTYVVRNCVTSDDVYIDQKISSMHHCTCEAKCVSFDCICCNNSLQSWYSNEGRLVANFNYSDPPMIFECNQICSCNAITCNNRIVQHGLTQRFQVFKTEMKGWGVRTLRSIPKGTFVCEYIGEIIADAEVEQREDDSYMFDLDNKEHDSFCIDAKYYGNFARFINHGCEPNLVPIRVFIDHHDLRFPRIALFASKNISSNEELSFDYGEKFWLIKYKSLTCDCGSSNCKYSEDSISDTIERYSKRLEEEMAT